MPILRLPPIRELKLPPAEEIRAEEAEKHIQLQKRMELTEHATEQDPVFHRAVISLDLALRHRVVSSAADVFDAFVLEPLAELARDVGWTVIAQ
jgi:hypothetical protein